MNPFNFPTNKKLSDHKDEMVERVREKEKGREKDRENVKEREREK
jgi:hypothetical protein